MSYGLKKFKELFGSNLEVIEYREGISTTGTPLKITAYNYSVQHSNLGAVLSAVESRLKKSYVNKPHSVSLFYPSYITTQIKEINKNVADYLVRDPITAQSLKKLRDASRAEASNTNFGQRGGLYVEELDSGQIIIEVAEFAATREKFEPKFGGTDAVAVLETVRFRARKACQDYKGGQMTVQVKLNPQAGLDEEKVIDAAKRGMLSALPRGPSLPMSVVWLDDTGLTGALPADLLIDEVQVSLQTSPDQPTRQAMRPEDVQNLIELVDSPLTTGNPQDFPPGLARLEIKLTGTLQGAPTPEALRSLTPLALSSDDLIEAGSGAICVFRGDIARCIADAGLDGETVGWMATRNFLEVFAVETGMTYQICNYEKTVAAASLAKEFEDVYAVPFEHPNEETGFHSVSSDGRKITALPLRGVFPFEKATLIAIHKKGQSGTVLVEVTAKRARS